MLLLHLVTSFLFLVVRPGAPCFLLLVRIGSPIESPHINANSSHRAEPHAAPSLDGCQFPSNRFDFGRIPVPGRSGVVSWGSHLRIAVDIAEQGPPPQNGHHITWCTQTLRECKQPDRFLKDLRPQTPPDQASESSGQGPTRDDLKFTPKLEIPLGASKMIAKMIERVFRCLSMAPAQLTE